MQTVEALIIKTYRTAADLRQCKGKQIKGALLIMADLLEQNKRVLLKANAADIAKQDADNPRNDRLLLNEERISSIAKSIKNISRLPSPVGKQLEKRILANGLALKKMTVPLGVV